MSRCASLSAEGRIPGWLRVAYAFLRLDFNNRVLGLRLPTGLILIVRAHLVGNCEERG